MVPLLRGVRGHGARVSQAAILISGFAISAGAAMAAEHELNADVLHPAPPHVPHASRSAGAGGFWSINWDTLDHHA